MIKPLITIAQYSHPTTDDYWMSMAVYRKWEETHSIWAVIVQAFNYAVGIYKTWDGNFLSMLLTSVSPLAFGESAYPFTFYFMFVTFIIGSAMATYGLLFRRWHMPVMNCISIMLLFITFFMSYIVSAGEGLYWWPGVANYTFFFGLLMFAHGLYAVYWEKNNLAVLIITSIFMFLVGLGNPFTALISTCLTVYELAYYVYKNKTFKTLRWIPFAAALLGLIIIVMAPGNKNRTPLGTTGIFETIYLSFYEGAILLKAITDPSFLFYYIMIAAISIYSFLIDDSITERKNFILAPLVCILMICLYFASLAPTKYTKSLFYGRVLDTYFFIAMMCFSVSVIYLCGAIVSWIKKKSKNENKEKFAKYTKYALAFLVVIIVYASKRALWNPKYFNTSNTLRAIGSMQFGAVQEYDRILDERYEELVNSTDWEIYITEPPYIPVFYHDDYISESAMSDYFKKKVILIQNE